VSCFKSLKEFLKDLIFSFLSWKNIRMLVGLVDTSDIIDINPTVTIFIELFVSLGNLLLSSHIHWSSNSSDEFIVSNGSTWINVEIVEDSLALRLGETELIVLKSFEEFHLV
jgi:hypothetical protein